MAEDTPGRLSFGHVFAARRRDVSPRNAWFPFEPFAVEALPVAYVEAPSKQSHRRSWIHREATVAAAPATPRVLPPEDTISGVIFELGSYTNQKQPFPRHAALCPGFPSRGLSRCCSPAVACSPSAAGSAGWAGRFAARPSSDIPTRWSRNASRRASVWSGALLVWFQ